MIRTIFWNRDERRLRFGWRMTGFTLISTLLTVILTALLVPSVRTGVLRFTDPAVFFRVSLASLIAYALTTVVTGLALDRRRLRDYGFRFDVAWWRDLAFGLALGAVLMGLIFLIEWAAGWVTVTGTLQTAQPGGFWGPFLLTIGAFLCIGIYEEVAFRGIVLTNTAEWLDNFKPLDARGAVIGATVLSALVFGLLHAMNPNAGVISTLNIVIAGLTILSLGYLLTGELAISIGVHITWNLFQAAIFGFPVSGIDIRTTVIAVDQGGPTWLTGGVFGPEAGLLGVLATLAGGALIALWVRHTRGKAEISVLAS